MTGNSINVGGDFEGNLIQDSNVLGDVSFAINELPASTNPEKPGIKELLTKLTVVIKNEPSLDEKSKVKALKQVEALAKAGQSLNNEGMTENAENALTMLRGIFSGIQAGATLFTEWNKLLPVLSNLFGIG